MKKFALLLLTSAFAAVSFAADKEVEELLAKMRTKYRDIGSVTFTMEATVTAPNGDVTVKMDGGFKSPNLMYADISAEGETAKVVCDGVKIYAVAADSKQVMEIAYNVDNMGAVLMGANLEIINFYDWKRQLSTAAGDNMHDSKLSLRKNVKWNNKTWTVLEESAPTVDVYVEYYIDPKTNLVWRTVQMSLDKEFIRGDFIIKAMKTGAKIDAKKFKKPVLTAAS
jgi:outer membrane lipoprotein-sorting protein